MPSDLSRLAALEQGAPARRPDPAAGSAPAPTPSGGGDVPPAQRVSSRPDAAPAGSALVRGGLASSRRSVRRWGAFAALVVPAILGALGALLLWNSETPWRGVPGFGLVVMAAPLMPLFGVPAEGGSTRYLLAIGASAVLWLVIGWLAARRATRRPVAGWADWRAEYLPMAIGAWIGGLGAVVIASIALGGQF